MLPRSTVFEEKVILLQQGVQVCIHQVISFGRRNSAGYKLVQTMAMLSLYVCDSHV